MISVNIFKHAIFQNLLDGLNTKIAAYESTMEELKESISNETKSTAGDKYETARAMLHIEQENVLRQLANANKQRSELMVLAEVGQSKIILPGSLIYTDKGVYYLSIGLGKIIVDNIEVIALSSISPLGKMFLGLTQNESLTFNSITYQILDVQ